MAWSGLVSASWVGGLLPRPGLVDCFEHLLLKVFRSIVAIVATQGNHTLYSLFRVSAVAAFSSSFELLEPMRSQHCL